MNEINENVKIKIGMFFDGTGQNANNLLASKTSDERKFSNIYRLFKTYTGKKEEDVNTYATKVYVEGVGTKNGAADSTAAMAVGVDVPPVASGYGVFSKYNNSRDYMVTELDNLLSTNQIKDQAVEISFDVFGFSRGAAIARHFVNQVKKQDITIYPLLIAVLNKYGCTLSEAPKTNFLGLFDTVATVWSLGTVWNDPHDTGDTNGLEVLIDRDVAKEGFQITARHECRYNFPLHSVKNTFPELELAGAHSDIGGSYATSMNEVSEVTYARYGFPIGRDPKGEVEKELATLRSDSHWTRLLKDTQVTGGWLPYSYYQGVSNRKNVEGQLQYVALLVMAKVAIEKGCDFDDAIFNYEQDIPADMKDYYQNSLDRKDALLAGGSMPIDQGLVDGITDKYIHISATWQNVLWPLSEQSAENASYSVQPAAVTSNYQPNRPEDKWVRKVFEG